MNKIQIVCPAKGFSNSDFVVFTEDGHERDNRLYCVQYQYGSLADGRTDVATVVAHSGALVDSKRLRLASDIEVKYKCRMLKDSDIEYVKGT